MNLVVLNGRLVRDPELKFGQSGKAYSRFSIAVDRPFQTSTDSQTADFINCVAFGKTAEFIGEYFRKGRKILLKGSLQMNQYESEGKKLTTYVVIAENVEFGEAKANVNIEGNDFKGTRVSTVKQSNFEELHSEDFQSADDDMESAPVADDEFPF